MSAVRRQREVRPGQARVKGNAGGDQQAARSHVLHLHHTGLWCEAVDESGFLNLLIDATRWTKTLSRRLSHKNTS